MIVRTEHGLKAIAQRPNTLLRIWRGRERKRILVAEHPELETGDEFFEVLNRFEPASWGSTVYRVRSDSTLQCLDDGE
ncbi:MAG: hypothetical protein HC902_07615 [Calothrix sp. SM1_5_4]|nr:hypothetical protein [Calothrix sp. SM1_5_4]